MSDEKHDIILPDAIVSVRISTGFYQKLQSVLNAVTKNKTKDEINKAYAQIKAKKITEEWVQQLETMFILLKEFQEEAKKAGFVRSMTEQEVKDYIKEKFPEDAKKIEEVDKKIAEKKEIRDRLDLDKVDTESIDNIDDV